MSDSTEEPDQDTGKDPEGELPLDEAPTLPQGASGNATDSLPTKKIPGGLGNVTEKPGDTIGPYKLLQKIGEGGFGVVYMAEQSSPVKRRVALKIIKPGMDTKEVIARFEAERQALALMDHPNIAKVLDAGATETGRPFFAMELVKGVSVTEYCDTHRLDTRKRLELFRNLCRAVQHAHQKGVIHRDLKPSNILVTLHDTKPVVKVIDFGVAKAISQELTEKTLFTAFGQMIGTPQYMSPEQSEVSGLDVDTRSDIYSLGVVLYELLTGRTPLDPQRLRQAGLDEIHRIIREEEPPKPSTRLTSLDNDEITAVAKSHGAAPERLSRLVRGDLDWIVMKALEKDRTRRYETATGFAEDIRRYLEDEAVLASPPSTAYRMGKFARRNTAALATAGVIVVTLIAAVVVSTWQAKVAWEARDAEAEQRKLADANALEAADKAKEAEESAEEAKAVLAFFQDKVLAAARPKEQAGGLGIDATIKAAIDAAEPLIGESFADRPLVEASIRGTLGGTYSLLGEAKAAISQERALELRRKLLGSEHRETLNSMGILAISYRDAGRHNEALALIEETLELQRKVQGSEHPHTLSSMGILATSYRDAGRYDEALALQEETLELKKKVQGPERPDTLGTMHNLANSYRDAGRHDEALALIEETLELQRKVQGPEHPNTLRSMRSLAISYRDAGRHNEALALIEETLELQRKVQGPEHPHTLQSMHELATSYRDTGRYDEALALNEETLEIRKKVLGPEHPITVDSAESLAFSYRKAGRLEDAELPLREYIAVLKRKGTDDRQLFRMQSSLGAVLSDQKQYAEAEPLLLTGYKGLQTIDEKGDPKWLRASIQMLVKLYTDWGKPEKAAEWQAKLDALESGSKK